MMITIIGMGEIGSAFSSILNTRKNVTVTPWDKNTSKISNQGHLPDVVSAADIILLCTPSWTLRNALISIKPSLKPTTGIVCLSKGIEKETCKTTDVLLASYLPEQPIGILGGPILAEELGSGLPAAGILGTTSSALKKQVKQAFKGTTLTIFTTSDTRGVAVAAVLKNTYALVLGIAEGLHLGESAKGTLIAFALKEMRKITKRLGGKEQTALGLAGIGDLFATGMSPYSQNRTVGIALSQGQDGGLASEGVMSLSCLATLLESELDHYPLLSYLLNVSEKREHPIKLREYLLGKNL